jgi:hypothetical protein
MSNGNTPENAGTWPDEVKLLASVGDGIPAMERQGQRQMVASTTLPTDLGLSSEADFTALGFTLGPVVTGDPLFREATLPDGWSRVGSEHAQGSHIVDERGLQRVTIFYKSAFYDRVAHMGLVNVGGAVATEWIYGDDDDPTLNPALTAEELADAKLSAEHYLKQAERYPHREDRVPRVHALIAAIESA